MIKEFALLAYLVGGAHSGSKPEFQLHSPVFLNHGTIPTRYTCRGNDFSIPLKWQGTPMGSESLVLVMTDKTAKTQSNQPFVHWILYNIPPRLHFLRTQNAEPARDEKVGLNSWSRANYRGPCPALGKHHYNITLYALDTELNLPNGATLLQLKTAMKDHIINTATLEGNYGHTVQATHTYIKQPPKRT
jgi:Raf kinase inhibitor-like YbhB/YbcL family protein